LRSGGIEPITIAPGVNEDAVAQSANELGLISSVEDMVHILAKAKAEAEAKAKAEAEAKAKAAAAEAAAKKAAEERAA
jgi:hypothetical protein